MEGERKKKHSLICDLFCAKRKKAVLKGALVFLVGNQHKSEICSLSSNVL